MVECGRCTFAHLGGFACSVGVSVLSQWFPIRRKMWCSCLLLLALSGVATAQGKRLATHTRLQSRLVRASGALGPLGVPAKTAVSEPWHTSNKTLCTSQGRGVPPACALL